MDDESIGAITQDYEILSLQSEINRLATQRDRLREALRAASWSDLIHDDGLRYAIPPDADEVENMYLALHPGDMTSD